MKTSADAFPPSGNTGGKSPLPVAIDYINFTVPGGKPDEIVAECMALLGIHEAEEGRGIHGYTSRVDLGGYGIVAHGGETQRGTVLVSINGAGCQRIASFRAVREWGESVNARLTRLDICADDHDGKLLDVRAGLEAWRAGQFTKRGRPPKARLIDDLGSGDGCTLNVGSRDSGLVCRLYEKGKQLGECASRWVRGEVEFHAKDRVIPWDAVTDPVRYLAGSFPFFSFLSMVAERIRTVKRQTQITIAQLQRWVRLSAGRAINALVKHEGGDIGAVIDQVRRDGFPSRLNDLWQAEARLRFVVST